MSIGPFVNGTDQTLIQQINNSSIIKNVDSIWDNNDASNKYYDAQKIADKYSKLKERKPMVFEYKKDKSTWTSITMYINPERLAVRNIKVKGKAITRGGIFYHHWGDDSPILTLSGTTGLSGMKGIEVLEDIYYASGTLLKYQKFGPEKYKQRTGQQSKELNLNSPTSIITAARGQATQNQRQELQTLVDKDILKSQKWEEYKKNQQRIDQLVAEGKSDSTSTINLLKLLQENYEVTYGFPTGKYTQLAQMTLPGLEKEIYNLKKLSSVTLKNFNELQMLEKNLDNIRKAELELDTTIENSNSKTMSVNNYKNLALTTFKKYLSTMSSDVLAAIVSQKAEYFKSGIGDVRIYSNISEIYATTTPIPLSEDLVGKMIRLSEEKQAALDSLLAETSKLEVNEKKYYNDLKNNAFDELTDEINDEWKPRQIFIYYENRAYVGHFDSFSYSRDAMNPLLIKYEIAITLTKQVIGTPK